MKWQILTIGKCSLAYAKSGIAEYEKRFRKYGQLEIRSVAKEAGSAKNSQALLEASEGTFRIVLDERGAALSTAGFSDLVQNWQLEGTIKTVSILIGGAEGHEERLRKKAGLLLGLSTFTLQHELALLVLMEQLYRVHTVLRGEPYHR